MFDLFFLSHSEPMADLHWSTLLTMAPHAQRIDGIDGIAAAHRACAEQTKTAMFWVVDADNEVLRDHDFRFRPPVWDRQYVHLWHARNPLNGLEYGWGGIKLFPRSLVRSLDLSQIPLDLTTSFPLKVVPSLASITHFNTSALATWRSAFRESVKLTTSNDPDARARLQAWTETAHGPFAAECLHGARAGRLYAIQNSGDPAALQRINHFAWLAAEFERSYRT